MNPTDDSDQLADPNNSYAAWLSQSTFINHHDQPSNTVNTNRTHSPNIFKRHLPDSALDLAVQRKKQQRASADLYVNPQSPLNDNINHLPGLQNNSQVPAQQHLQPLLVAKPPKEKDNKPRALRACDACRKNKSRCEAVEGTDPPLCKRCQHRSAQCSWDLPAVRRKVEVSTVNGTKSVKDAQPAASTSAFNLSPSLAEPSFSTSATASPSSARYWAPLNQDPMSMPLTSQRQYESNDMSGLRDAVAAEEQEAERLQLLLKYKQLQKNNENMRNQLQAFASVKTPPELRAASP